MGTTKRNLVAVVIVVTAALALMSTASAQGPAANGKPADKGWSALDNVVKFQHALDKAGFDYQEGTVEYMDWVQGTCEGKLLDTAFNNPAPNAYATITLPAHPGVGKPLADWLWQLDKNDAVILIGQTPPAAAYFSYQTILGVLPVSPWPPPPDYVIQRVAPSVGDAINIGTIHTTGPDRVERPLVIIITGHRRTEQAVRKALLAAGYPAAVINVEAIAPALGPLGTGGEGSWFYYAHRVSVPANQSEVIDYLQNIGKLDRVFRVTPNDQLAEQLGDDPEPVPVLRVRGTGHTEMDLYPALKRLRQAVLDHYAGVQHTELDTHVFTARTWLDKQELIAEKPYAGLQRGITSLGVTRDTNYLGTYPEFMLREGEDEFVIVYGVNHQRTGKATYAAVGAYADLDRWFGLGSALSPDFGDSARVYLPDDPQADMLYVLKVARHCGAGEAYCMQIDQPKFLDLWGEPYETNPQCSLDNLATEEYDPSPFNLDEQKLFFIFRSYMEPATLVGPDDNELLYDRAIYFGPYVAKK
jgi:hypothetical protein